MGENIHKGCDWQRGYSPKYTNSSYNSTSEKPISEKNGHLFVESKK